MKDTFSNEMLEYAADGTHQNIEDMPEGQQVVTYWQRFLPTVKKLHEEFRAGKNTTGGYSGDYWWASRFSDFLTNNNSAPKTHEEYIYRKIGYDIFPLIWSKYKDILTNPMTGF